MSAQQCVGVADHYAAFVKLCRLRIEQLGITYETVDEICTFPDRYTATLMSGGKAMSVYSFFTIARALALLPAFQHDDKQHARLAAREKWILMKRKGPRWRRKNGSRKNSLGPDYWKNLSIVGNLSRTKKLSPRRRSQIARKAILARWEKQRVADGA